MPKTKNPLKAGLLGILCLTAGGFLPAMAWNYPIAGGESFFIQPADPHEDDEIVVVYPQRGCGYERVDAVWEGGEIVVTVNHQGSCLYSGVPAYPGQITPLGGLYGQYRLGRLAPGNYRVRLYYRDLATSSSSRSFSMSESFSVMPKR